MDSQEQKVIDWVNLPETVDTLSLWETLHDGDLLGIESDLLARTVTLSFDVDYVRDFHQLPKQTRFIVTVNGVQSVRSLCTVPWPGKFSVPQGTNREEESRLISDYQRKWREESRSWGDLERLIGEGLEVSNGLLARGSNTVALQLGIMAGNGSYLEAYIRGDGIDFYVGKELVKPEKFVGLGAAYWEAFAQRKLK